MVMSSQNVQNSWIWVKVRDEIFQFISIAQQCISILFLSSRLWITASIIYTLVCKISFCDAYWNPALAHFPWLHNHYKSGINLKRNIHTNYTKYNYENYDKRDYKQSNFSFQIFLRSLYERWHTHKCSNMALVPASNLYLQFLHTVLWPPHIIPFRPNVTTNSESELNFIYGFIWNLQSEILCDVLIQIQSWWIHRA